MLLGTLQVCRTFSVQQKCDKVEPVHGAQKDGSCMRLLLKFDKQPANGVDVLFTGGHSGLQQETLEQQTREVPYG